LLGFQGDLTSGSFGGLRSDQGSSLMSFIGQLRGFSLGDTGIASYPNRFPYLPPLDSGGALGNRPRLGCPFQLGLLRICGCAQAVGSATAGRFVDGLIERVEFLRKLGIDRERQQAIPASAFDRIAREALKISAQHFAEAVAPRRHALLTAAALSLETGLTDATLLMFDKLMGSLSRKAERRSQEKAAKSARDLQEKLRALTGACTAMIRARENRDDPFCRVLRTRPFWIECKPA